MTNYSTTATPITDEAGVGAALAAGARIEFTAIGSDTYTQPPHDQPESGGWVLARRGEPSRLLGWGKLRAFYPEQAEAPAGEWVRYVDEETVPEGTRVRVVSVDGADRRLGIAVGDEGVAKDTSRVPWVEFARLGIAPALHGTQLERFVPAEQAQQETPDDRIAADWAGPCVSEGFTRPDEAPVADPTRPFYFVADEPEPDDATIGAPDLSPGPAQPPRFSISVNIHAESQEGYQAAVAALAEGLR